MSEWLWWVGGSACGLFAVFKLLATGWCVVELRRKWRAVPELWGVDWLDVVLRLERAFGVPLTAADFQGMPPSARVGLTAGQLWEVVEARLSATGTTAPADGWGRFVTALSEALYVRPERVTPGARLYSDLGMAYGLD